jgi:hypothetical protein
VTQSKIASNSVGASEIIAGAVGTSEIANGAVTADKLAPGAAGDRMSFLSPSVEGLYLPGQSVIIDWTVADLSAWIPANARAAIVQLGMASQAVASGARAEMRVRTNDAQREAICVSSPMQDKTMWNAGIVPLQNTGNRTVEYRLDVVGAITVTIWITIVGYVI